MPTSAGDSLTWSILFGGVSTVAVAFIGGIFAFRTGKLQTELAAKRLEMERQQGAAKQWQELAEHYNKRLTELETQQKKPMIIQRRRRKIAGKQSGRK